MVIVISLGSGRSARLLLAIGAVSEPGVSSPLPGTFGSFSSFVTDVFRSLCPFIFIYCRPDVFIINFIKSESTNLS